MHAIHHTPQKVTNERKSAVEQKTWSSKARDQNLSITDHVTDKKPKGKA
jgi:hypothetical protein